MTTQPSLIRTVDPKLGGQKQLATIQDRILTLTLRAAIVLGAGALAATLPGQIDRQSWGLFALYIGAYLWVIIVALVRIIPYPVRAGSFLAILFLLGVSGLLESGLSGDGRVFLLGFMVITTLLTGWKSGLIALLLSALSMTGIGFGMLQGYLAMPPIELLANTTISSEWISGGVNLIFLAVFGLVQASMLMGGLQGSLNKQTSLSTELETERQNLQDRVMQQTEGLERRLVQLRTAAEVSSSIVAYQDPEILLHQVVTLIRDRFELYYVGAFLLDEKEQFAVLRAGTGDAGEKMLAGNHRLAVGGSSMIGWAVERRQARIALDVGQEAVRFNNPHLPLTRSEMALPLMSRENILGALTIQSAQPAAFDEDDIRVLQGIADNVATALENASLLQETQANLDEIRALHRQYLAGAWAELANARTGLEYGVTAEGVGEAGMGSQFHLPLSLRDQVIGEVAIETRERDLSPEDLVFIDAVTTQTALALENARLLEESQRRASHELTLSDMTVQFSRAIQVDDILKIALQELGKLPTVSEVAIVLNAPQDPGIDPVSISGDPLTS